jgi:hypothetical protein
VMSALPPKADVCGANRHVRFGPEADMAKIIQLSGRRAPEMSLASPTPFPALS